MDEKSGVVCTVAELVITHVVFFFSFFSYNATMLALFNFFIFVIELNVCDGI